MPNPDRAQPPTRDDLHGGWSRRRLVAILAGAGLAATVLAAAFGYGVYRAVTQATDPQATGPAHSETMAADDPHSAPESFGAPGRQRRDAIAAAPMLVVPPSAAHPPADADGFSEPGASTTGAPSIEIPAGDAVPGPALVMSGFPHTPQGAVAQLAQIDVAVLQSMSLATAREVHDAWALPGGASSGQWWITASVRAFLDAASMPGAKDPAVWVQVEPAAAMVKGTDGTGLVDGVRPAPGERQLPQPGRGRLRPLRAHAVGGRTLDDRPRHPSSRRAVDLAGHGSRVAGRVGEMADGSHTVRRPRAGVRPQGPGRRGVESRDGGGPRRSGEWSECFTTAVSCSLGPTHLDGPGGRAAGGTAKVDLRHRPARHRPA